MLAQLGADINALPLLQLDKIGVSRADVREGQSSVAVGETVILLTPPSPSLLKYLLKGEGGAAE